MRWTCQFPQFDLPHMDMTIQVDMETWTIRFASYKIHNFFDNCRHRDTPTAKNDVQMIYIASFFQTNIGNSQLSFIIQIRVVVRIVSQWRRCAARLVGKATCRASLVGNEQSRHEFGEHSATTWNTKKQTIGILDKKTTKQLSNWIFASPFAGKKLLAVLIALEHCHGGHGWRFQEICGPGSGLKKPNGRITSWTTQLNTTHSEIWMESMWKKMWFMSWLTRTEQHFSRVWWAPGQAWRAISEPKSPQRRLQWVPATRCWSLGPSGMALESVQTPLFSIKNTHCLRAKHSNLWT